ncbi:MAG: hypothetical protein WC683_01555 [bacterium]
MSWSEPGFGFFGKGFWGRRVLWDNVPIQQRELDAHGYLEQLLGIYGDELEAFLGAIGQLPIQRDPYEARADSTESEWFYVGEARAWASDVWGSVTRLIGEADFSQMPNTGDPLAAPVGPADRYPWYPYAPISSTARWWRTTIPAVDDVTGAEDPTEYKVALVRTRSFDQAAIYAAGRSLANEVWVQGGELALPFQRPAGWVVTGNAATDAGVFGSGVPVGRGDGTAVPPVTLPGPLVRLRSNTTGTALGAAIVLDILTDAGPLRLYDVPDPTPDTGTLYRAVDPMNPVALDLVNPLGTVDYLGGTLVPDLGLLGVYSIYDVPMTAHWLARGYYLQFMPPRVLDHLAKDYGFDNDRNDPEDRQRAAIAHLWQYFGCKGAQDAYRIRGEISLFDVVVQGLWHICDADLAAMLPAAHVFEYGGTWYTDLEPRSLRFDDIRGDEQYYDTFDHDPILFPSPAWLTLADRAYLYEDAAMTDGMSVGLAFALDVTQGYYGQVSEVDPLPRTPAIIIAADALSATEAASMNLAAGYRVTVEMMRCQADAFSFRRGNFGLTVYEHGVTPPALDDQVYWIDYEDAAWTVTAPVPGFPDQDVGRWTVIVGTGVGATVPGPGAHVAVRYWPEVDKGDCCYCRSYRVRVLIEPKAQAYDHYGTDAEMQVAIARLQAKIEDKLLPIHARVAEWVVTTEWDLTMLDMLAGRLSEKVLTGGEFLDLGISGRVLLTMEQRGELAAPGNGHRLRILQIGGGAVFPTVDTGALPVQSGVNDPVTWYPVAGWVDRDITDSVDDEVDGVRVRAEGFGAITYGDVRWTFRVTRSTLG